MKLYKKKERFINQLNKSKIVRQTKSWPIEVNKSRRVSNFRGRIPRRTNG